MTSETDRKSGEGAASATAHHQVRADWLNSHAEPAIEPDLPIVDAHHHLWDMPGNRYLLPDYLVDLATGQAQRDGTAISVNEGMDLAREATSGTSHAAISSSPFLPVAPCWWTRTHLESIITISPAKAAETAASSRSHTPALRQRTNRL